MLSRIVAKSMLMFALNECEHCKNSNNYEIANIWWHIGMILAINWDDVDVSLYVETDFPRPSAEDCWGNALYYDLYTIEVDGLATSIPMPLLNEGLRIAFERNADEVVERERRRHHSHIHEGDDEQKRNAQKETFHRFVRWMDSDDRYDAMQLDIIPKPPPPLIGKKPGKLLPREFRENFPYVSIP